MFTRKSITVLLALTLIAALAAACGGKDKKVDLGVTGAGTYTNDYFGVSLNFPKDWDVQDAEGMNELAEAGKELIAGDDAKKKKQLDLAEAKTLNLLVVSQYPLGGEELGASFMSVAEKVSKLQGIESGKDYLEASKKLMEQSGVPYEYHEITTAKVGGKDFDVMQVTLDAGDFVVTQDYYSTLIEGYAFNFISTYVDDASKASIDEIVQSVSFK